MKKNKKSKHIKFNKIKIKFSSNPLRFLHACQTLPRPPPAASLRPLRAFALTITELRISRRNTSFGKRTGRLNNNNFNGE